MLAPSRRITKQNVIEEIARLKATWEGTSEDSLHQLKLVLSTDQIEQLDLFDRFQLCSVIETCLESPSLSEAGRRLFAVSRQAKKQPNDADRLRKYLARFNIAWSHFKELS